MTSALPPRAQSLIEYPCDFPVKVMGLKADGFHEAICGIAARHDPFFEAAKVEVRDSSGGRYQGLTLTITATSREQLDALYRELTGHAMVKVVL